MGGKEIGLLAVVVVLLLMLLLDDHYCLRFYFYLLRKAGGRAGEGMLFRQIISLRVWGRRSRRQGKAREGKGREGKVGVLPKIVRDKNHSHGPEREVRPRR